MHPLLENLNPVQCEAVTAPAEHLLILAGAGSGKTRVLVHRMAWLVQEMSVPPHHILAVTFTNKAAREIKERVEHLLGIPAEGLWLGTFHGIAHRFLRIHHEAAKLPQNFVVLDSDDQLRLIKRIVKSMDLDDKHYDPKKIQHFINSHKDHAERPGNLKINERDFYKKTFVEVYRQYEALCQQNGCVDFAELLLRSFEVLRDHETIRMLYQERFEHILVDEFQDTNTLQYLWLKMLMGKDNKLMVVGDDDQSIYGWRGAKIENIHKVQKDFPGRIIRLEQNYRSTQNILNAANSVIDNNDGRLGKKLWTEGAQGEPIYLYSAFNELDEARFVADRIKELQKQGYTPQQIAILYRANAQSRVMEEALLQAHIPYRVYGGLRFFDRAEIKNALAYLRLASNANDDVVFERVINFPTRGIGERSLTFLRDSARQKQISLWQALKDELQQNILGSRAGNALKEFYYLILELHHLINDDRSTTAQCEAIIKKTGLIEHYQAEGDDINQGRVENLEELVNAVGEFVYLQQKEGLKPTLNDFLAHAALESSIDKASDHNSVQMMTLHSAKGLEFPCVFLVGFEDELFPARAASEDPSRLEEERRLCYVGMTRAMKLLFISYAENRRLYGESKTQSPSRFLLEIPKSILTPLRLQQQNPRAHYRFTDETTLLKPQATSQFKIGQTLQHPKFGEGIVLQQEGQDEHARLQIKFRDVGIKWIMASFFSQ
jgi:DNA helicase II / ATP-dependent DNA helicase PcrA